MKANCTMIPRRSVHVFCVLLAFGCAPDQFVSMGSDVGGAGSGVVAAGATHTGGAGANSTTSSTLGGASSQGGAASGGETNGLVIGVLR